MGILPRALSPEMLKISIARRCCKIIYSILPPYLSGHIENWYYNTRKTKQDIFVCILNLWNVAADNVKQPMMTSSNANIFRVTDPLWEESTGGSPVDFPQQGQWRRTSIFLSVPKQTVEHTIETLVRRHRAHYDVTVICYLHLRSHCVKILPVRWHSQTNGYFL